MKLKKNLTFLCIILTQFFLSSCSEQASQNEPLKVPEIKTAKKDIKKSSTQKKKLKNIISFSEVEKILRSQIESFHKDSIKPGIQKITFFKSGDDEYDFEEFYKIVFYGDYDNKLYEKWPYPHHNETNCVYFPAEKETILKVDRYKVITHKIKVWIPSVLSKETPKCVSYLEEKLSNENSFFLEWNHPDDNSREEKLIVYYDKKKVFFGDQNSKSKNTEEVLNYLKGSKTIQKFDNLIVAKRRNSSSYNYDITEISLPYNGNINRIDCGLYLRITPFDNRNYFLKSENQIPYNGSFKMEHKFGVYKCNGLTRELAEISMSKENIKMLFNKNLPKTIIE